MRRRPNVRIRQASPDADKLGVAAEALLFSLATGYLGPAWMAGGGIAIAAPDNYNTIHNT